jgi:alpha-galactosidase
VWVQKLAVEAAVNADISLLYQSALMDPLTGAVCTTAQIRQMVDEMLIAGEQWLPQYSEEIERAKERMSAHTPDYKPVKGIRKAEKTVAEMEEDSRKYRELSAAAAKENVK